MNKNTQIMKDLNTPNHFGGVNKGMYNLIVCTNAVKQYTKGIKPHRYWRLKDVKNYFGLNGGTSSILKQLQAIKSNIDNIIKDINLNGERD